MNDVNFKIANLFSSSATLLSQNENCNEYFSEYQINDFSLSVSENDILSLVNTRDRIGLHIYPSDNEDSIDYLSSKKNNWTEFINDLETENFQQARIRIQIEKKIKDSKISLYNVASFTEYIDTLSLTQFLSVLNECFNSSLIFEYQEEYNEEWMTNTIAFVDKDSEPKLNGIGSINRQNRIDDARDLCYSETKRYFLLPDDLIPLSYNERNKLQTSFINACMVYTSCMIFDYSDIRDNIYTYKLNGFKTLHGRLNIEHVTQIPIDKDSCQSLYEIYRWLYLGGKDNDKINIARNIISLNIDEDTLKTNSTTFESILSNYKIYEKDNVRQYLNLRNKLSEILIDLQEKISSIVDSFINDFKKNILTLLSFFISVIVIRVVSKGDFIGGFTNEIIGLSITFIVISIFILMYSRWELDRKISLYDKHYEQIKNRYKDILSKTELDNIFEDCDPKRDKSNSFFVQEQKKRYSIVWILSIIALFVFLIIVYIINNKISVTYLINNIICYIQNIFQ